QEVLPVGRESDVQVPALRTGRELVHFGAGGQVPDVDQVLVEQAVDGLSVVLQRRQPPAVSGGGQAPDLGAGGEVANGLAGPGVPHVDGLLGVGGDEQAVAGENDIADVFAPLGQLVLFLPRRQVKHAHFRGKVHRGQPAVRRQGVAAVDRNL